MTKQVKHMDLEDLHEVISAYQECVAETVRRFDYEVGQAARMQGFEAARHGTSGRYWPGQRCGRVREESAVEPTRSENITVTWRRSAEAVEGAG
jgi:hypothetical protein